MPSIPGRATRWLCFALALTLAGLLRLPSAPNLASAQEAAGLAPGGTATIANAGGDAVLLRDGPGYEAAVLASLPEGTPVELLDGPLTGTNGTSWFQVAAGGQTGFVPAGFLAPAAAPPAPATEPAADLPATTDGQSAVTTADVNLRAGAGYDEDVLRVIPAGAAVAATGNQSNGFLGVTYDGQTGWVDAAYLDLGAVPDPTAESAATPPPDSPLVADPSAAPPGEAATATELVNLRAGPSAGDEVLRVLPAGATAVITGAATNGYLPVWYNGTNGWVAADYLSFGGAPPAASPTASPAEDEAPAAAFSGIIWPVSGGTWYIMQGYNGSSHQNRDGTWQYYYSLDLARRDGETAGQTVISPVSGTVRWTDPSTGGISIDVGDGHAVAFFHVAIDPSIAWGDPIEQGQYVGTISGPGGPGFAGTPHLHLTLWETSDGGNWSRVAAPFVGRYAISGQEFPDIGGSNQHRGTEFTP